MDPRIATVKERLRAVQNTICTMVETHDSARFHEDSWVRPTGGGGITRVISGNIMEQAGVNFSHVHGDSLPGSATQHRPELAGKSFEALGVSVVMHPTNPHIPTSHFNVRYFQAGEGDNAIWWVGGGFDLTPYYGDESDCIHWHQHAKDACDAYDETLYPRFKAWCDDYFYLKHRQEPRGIGGIFFDDFNELGFEKSINFLEGVGDHYTQAYDAIIAKHRDAPYGEHEREFQAYRRGRYVEFNLVYDRGTLFGLQSGGRTESILMSLPPQVRWGYQWQPESDSQEAALYKTFLTPREWV